MTDMITQPGPHVHACVSLSLSKPGLLYPTVFVLEGFTSSGVMTTHISYVSTQAHNAHNDIHKHNPTRHHFQSRL